MDLPDNVHVLPSSRVLDVLMTTLRDKETRSPEFRWTAKRLSRLLVAQALEEEPVDTVEIETPLEHALGWRFGSQAALVPVLRAGNALVDAFTEQLPDPHVWHLGLRRDHETHKPFEYDCKIPLRISDRVRTCYVNDPMLATGGSADYAVSLLKSRGAERVVFVGVVGAPEGIAFLHERHPDVPIYLATVEEGLNSLAYIINKAIGDFGDRYYNTF